MSNTIAYVDNQTLVNIADAVRNKTGTNEKMLLSDIPDKIENFEGIVPTGTQTITDNGTYNVSSYASAVVDVQPDLRPLSVTENGQYSPDGFDGYSRVEVSVEGQWIDYDDVPVTLPEEYQRVEYIESSGTQFIELPIGFYPTDEVRMKGSVDISSPKDSYMVAPKTWNNSDNRFCMCGWSNAETNFLSKSFAVGFGIFTTGRTQFFAPYENDGNIHSYLYKDRIFVLADMGMTCVVSHVIFGSETANLKLFYGYNSNTAGKICYYIHKKADGRKLVLYACYRKSDGVIGMYDVENDVFYTNDGTGDFTKGADV